MPMIISIAERDSFVSGIIDHYDTFSSLHTLTIVKEPLKTLVNIDNQEYNGYGQTNPVNYTLTPVSGDFTCMTYDKQSWEDDVFDPVPVQLSKGDMIIKVTNIEKDYFENGKNELIILDNETYNVVGGPVPTNYATQKYWYYSLQRTT